MPTVRHSFASALGTSLLALCLACQPEQPKTDNSKSTDCIIAVTIDTLRADHLPMYGYPRATAPFLTRLSERGVVFEKAFSASSHTAPSHASLFTSLFPSEHGVRKNGDRLDESIPTIATELRDAGYRTGAFSSVGWLRQIGQGFENFTANSSGYTRGDQLVDRALAWLNEIPKNEAKFLWLHFFDVHEFQEMQAGGATIETDPHYVAAKNALEKNSKSPPDWEKILSRDHGVPAQWARRILPQLIASVSDYDTRIRYVDGELERLQGALPEFCAPEKTRWFVTSDHGEGLMTSGRVGHGRYLHHEQLHVPLIYYAADLQHPGTRVPQLVRLVDLPATIADAAGAAWPQGKGYSLLGLARGDASQYPVRVNFAQRRSASTKRLKLGWTDGEVLTIHDADKRYILRTQAPDLFFDRSVDPFETQPLSPTDHPEANRWQKMAVEEWERVQNSETPAKNSESTNPRYRDQLRALGYIE